MGSIVCCLGMVQLAAAADATMPFKYRNTVNGVTIDGSEAFIGVAYLTTGAYCAANHRDPDGNKYVHAHLPDHFPFVPSGSTDNVTAQKSDWAWDAYYSSYTRVSGSTFSKNCFAYVAGSPTVMFYDGWTQFTTNSSQCEITTKPKSYGDSGHIIAITAIYTEFDPCVISESYEKNASGGVYSHEWLPEGQVASGEVTGC